MLSCSIWVFAPSFWMGCGLASRCVGRVYGADGAVHGTIGTVHATICCNATSNAPDDGHTYPKHIELRITSIILPSCIKLAFHVMS